MWKLPPIEVWVPNPPYRRWVAYRFWYPRLADRAFTGTFPLACRTPWRDREMRATCLQQAIRAIAGRSLPAERLHDPELAPVAACRCGIHDYRTPPDIPPWPTLVAGLITISGRVMLEGYSLRAEHARVEALCIPGAMDEEHRGLVEETAARWGVPLVQQQALPEIARELGDEPPAA